MGRCMNKCTDSFLTPIRLHACTTAGKLNSNILFQRGKLGTDDQQNNVSTVIKHRYFGQSCRYD